MKRPPLEWDALVEGQQFGPYDYHVDQKVVASLRASVGDESLVLFDGEPVAPATILTFPFLQLLESAYVPPPGVIHASQEFDLLAPVRVGSTLTCTGTLTAKYIRRSRRYFTLAAQAVDERGVTAARSRTTGLYPTVDLRRTGG